MFEGILEPIEPILAYIGIFILGTPCAGLFGIRLLIWLARMRELSAKSKISQALNRFIRQCIRALFEFAFIGGLGVFFGICIGAATKLLIHIPTATSSGAFMGGMLGTAYALSLITTKWGHCYLNKHDYIQEGEIDGDDLVDQCKLCGKYLD